MDFLGKRTELEEISGLTTKLRTVWEQWYWLNVRDEILYQQWKNYDSNVRRQIVVPKSIKNNIICVMTILRAGHLMQRKTLQRVRQRFYWPSLRREVKEWCRYSIQCAHRNYRVPNQGRLFVRIVANTLCNGHSVSWDRYQRQPKTVDFG